VILGTVLCLASFVKWTFTSPTDAFQFFSQSFLSDSKGFRPFPAILLGDFPTASTIRVSMKEKIRSPGAPRALTRNGFARRGRCAG